MKKYLFFAVAVAAVAACAKSGPDVGLADGNQFPTDKVSAPTPITFGSNVSSINTRSQGGVDSWNGKQDLYVYCYEADKENGTIIDIGEPYIDNVKAASPAEGSRGLINVYDDAAAEAQTPYYYQESTVYKFFGYYTDGAATEEPSVVEGKRSVPVTIDGGQDIMLAVATPKDDLDRALEGNASNQDLLTIKEKYENLIYSGYTARRNITPTLVFRHQLVRLKFQIVAGNENAAQNIKVTDISLLDVCNKGNLVIAPEDQQRLEVDNTVTTTLKLQEESDGTLQALTPMAPPADVPAQIGESLMVMLADSYRMQFTLQQTGIADPRPSKVYTLNKDLVDVDPDTDGIQSPDNLKIGYEYVVTIKIFGLEDIEIYAELKPWEPGGNITIDPDDPDNFGA